MDVNLQGSQEELGSNREPARNLVGDAVSGVKFGPFLLALAGICLPPFLPQRMGWSAVSYIPLVFAQSLFL